MVTPLKGEIDTTYIERSSLISEDLDVLLEEVILQTLLPPSAVEDVYPYTSLQSYWVDCTLNHPGELQALWVNSFPASIDILRLQRA